MIHFYSDRRVDWNIHQIGIVFSFGLVCIAFPMRLELWENVTTRGSRRLSLFGLDYVIKGDSRAIDLTLLFLLFSVAWEHGG